MGWVNSDRKAEIIRLYYLARQKTSQTTRKSRFQSQVTILLSPGSQTAGHFSLIKLTNTGLFGMPGPIFSKSALNASKPREDQISGGQSAKFGLLDPRAHITLDQRHLVESSSSIKTRKNGISPWTCTLSDPGGLFIVQP